MPLPPQQMNSKQLITAFFSIASILLTTTAYPQGVWNGQGSMPKDMIRMMAMARGITNTVELDGITNEAILYKTVNELSDAAATKENTIPVIVPYWGTNHSVVTVTIKCPIPGAEAYYTLDGSKPGSSSQIYKDTLLISNSVKLVSQLFMKEGEAKKYFKERADKTKQQEKESQEKLEMQLDNETIDQVHQREAAMRKPPYDGYTLTEAELKSTRLIPVSKISRLNLSFDDSLKVGIMDGWKLYYFNNVGISPDNPAPSGRGETLKQAYENGHNPIDFYVGTLPNLKIISGNSQTGTQGTLLKNPLLVSVTDSSGSLISNAPVHFEIHEGGGIFKSPNGQLSSSLDSRTDSSGTASASFVLLCHTNSTSAISCSASSGTNSTNVTFTERSNTNNISSDSIATYNMTAVLNIDGSVDASWENNTSHDDTNEIDITYRNIHGNWAVAATAPAQSTYYHIPKK